jgi:hypothetical protein
MAKNRWRTHGTRASFVAACLAMAAVGCSGKGAGPRPTDGGDAPGADGVNTEIGGADTRGATDAAVTGADAAVSEIAAQYRSCVAYARAQCNRRSVCGGTEPSADPCPTITDTCPDLEFVSGSLRTVDTLLACAEAWNRFPCDDLLAGKYPACAGIAGTLPDGAPCVSSLQCTGKLCGLRKDAQHPRCGACATAPAAPSAPACGTGDACQTGEECLEGQCVRHTQDRKVGESCGGSVVCAVPNKCTSSSGHYTCQPLPKLGDACQSIIRCADSLCSAGHVCEAWPTAGMPCKRDAVLSRFMCDDAVACDESAAGGPTCIARGSAGGACKTTGSLEQSSCAVGLICGCSDGTGTCGAGTCVRRRQEGDTCGAPADLCVPGTKCLEGRCAPVSQGWMAAFCGA